MVDTHHLDGMVYMAHGIVEGGFTILYQETVIQCDLHDAALLGKNTGMDAALDKLTWVALKGVEGTARDAEEQVDLAIQALDSMPWDTTFFRELAQSMTTRKM